MTLTELRELLAQAIKDTEFESHTYFAGGCVRDFLLNPETTIIEADIAVELPEGGIKLAYFLQEKFNTTAPVIHKSFGTAKMTINNIKIELVMTRSEKYPPVKDILMSNLLIYIPIAYAVILLSMPYIKK